MKQNLPITATLLATCALLALPGLVQAQRAEMESLPPSKWNDERVQKPTRPPLKVEVSPMPREIQLRPALVEQKFLAEVRIAPPDIQAHQVWNRGILRRSLPDDLMLLRSVGDHYLLDPNLTRMTPKGPSLSKSVAAWLKHVPPGKIPADELKFFESDEVDLGLLMLASYDAGFSGRGFGGGGYSGSEYGSDPGPVENSTQSFYVFGRTEKECETRAKTLLTILDYGFTRPIQQHLLTQRQELDAKLATTQANREATNAELARLAKELKDYSDYSEDILPGLRQQQMALEVDLAGTTARIEACNLLLAKPTDKGGLSQERRGTVEDTKIQAEISLAGFQSQRAKLEEFVKKAKTRAELDVRQLMAEQRVSVLTNEIATLQGRILETEAQLAYFAPVTVVDDKIVVHPVQWATR
jgi:hypothetical protein